VALFAAGQRLEDAKQLASAESDYRRALALRQARLGGASPELVLTLNRLANLLRVEGKSAEAEQLLRRAVSINGKIAGATPLAAAPTLDSLHTVLAEWGKWGEATAAAQTSLQIKETALGPQHPAVVAARAEAARSAKIAQRTVRVPSTDLPANHIRPRWRGSAAAFARTSRSSTRGVARTCAGLAYRPNRCEIKGKDLRGTRLEGMRGTALGSKERESAGGKRQQMALRWRESLEIVVLVSCGVMGVACCSPAIKAFHVRPETYCASTKQISITWDATGDTTLTIDPLGKVFHAPQGEAQIAAQPMSISIEAVRNHRKAGQPPRNVAPMPAVRPLVAQAGLECDATSAKTSVIPVGPDEYDPESLLASISNDCQSTDTTDPCPVVRVCHGPDPAHVCVASWQVVPGKSVPISGVSISGLWQLSRPLQAGETCGPEASSGRPATSNTRSVLGRHMTHLKVQLALVCT
jgi:Tetratricopeptide repeat